MPMVSLERGEPVYKGGKLMVRVIAVYPRAAKDAVGSHAAAVPDGFYTPAEYRGAFAPAGPCWLCGWTAVDRFGLLESSACEPSCPADITGDGTVDVLDLREVLGAWGPCL